MALLFLCLMEKTEDFSKYLYGVVLKKSAISVLLFYFLIMAHKIPPSIEWRLKLAYT